jgi:hypothetical protein
MAGRSRRAASQPRRRREQDRPDPSTQHWNRLSRTSHRLDGFLTDGLKAKIMIKFREQVTVRTDRYSVPVRLVGRQVRVQLHASHLVVYDGRDQVAWHERLMAKAGARLDLDHHLEALVRKPGALPGATALEQARAAGRFTPVHDVWWAAARKAHGDAAGTRALIEVLLLHRHMPHEHVVAGLATAVRAGALTADAVALEGPQVRRDRRSPSRPGARTAWADHRRRPLRRPARRPDHPADLPGPHRPETHPRDQRNPHAIPRPTPLQLEILHPCSTSTPCNGADDRRHAECGTSTPAGDVDLG